MKAEQFNTIMDKLKAACAKEPTPAQYDVLVESITDNGLTDAEIMRGYQASRDAAEPWWPKPGEFLARARPSVSPEAKATLYRTEAETIFELILEHPERYGKYNPNSGRIYDRRRVEELHGRAAGIAFAAVASRFGNLNREDPMSMTFVRKEFVEAYDGARSDNPPPTITPPAKQIPARPMPVLVAEGPSNPESEKRLETIIRGPIEPPLPNFEERKAILLDQAKALMEQETSK